MNDATGSPETDASGGVSESPAGATRPAPHGSQADQHPGEEPGAKPAPARALTRRETDVVRLLAAGCTDRQIADELSISRKTASNHVSSILRKAGAPRRAGIARFAVRAGLIGVMDLPAPQTVVREAT
ncbi:MAG: LuxR C-terminal-related transcriptional regulator [Thermomicrobiales bacterium]